MTLLGFPIYIDLSWFIIFIVLTWLLATQPFPRFYDELSTTVHWIMGVCGALGLFASVLLHELGHAVVARRFGVRMRGITLFIFGGVAEMRDQPSSAKAEFWVAIGGPIVSLLLAILFWLGWGYTPLPPAVEGVIWYLAAINTAVLVFNMIPAFPLDGGRVLRAALWQWQGSLRKATRTCAFLGQAFGLFLIIMAAVQLFNGVLIGALVWFALGLFLRGAASMSYQQVLLRQALQGEPVKDLMNDQPITVEPSTTIRRFVEDYVYQYHHRMFPVLDGDQLVGSISTNQIKDVDPNQWDEATVDQIARKPSDGEVLKPEDDALEAMNRLNQSQQSQALVVEGQKLRGIISLKDLMKYISLKMELESDEPASMSPAA